MSTWRPALRIARRTVVRSPGRSLLISLLVALPVAGATYADVVARTFSSPQLQAQHMVGAADGAVTITPQIRLAGYDPRWLAEPFSTATGQRRDPASVDVASVLPSGTRIAGMPRFQPVDISSDRGIVRTRILLGDVRQPLQRFLLEAASGSRLPRAGEVLLTRSLAKRLDLLDGDGHLRSDAVIDLVNGPSARVAGFARDPSCLSCEQIVAAPNSPVVHAAAQRSPSSGYAYDVQNADPTSYPTYLVDLPAGTDTAILGRKLAAEGIALTTRTALAHPRHAAGGSVSAGGLVALIAALGLLEVVLLAGAAFAVGARRQVRELGLIAATGGSGRDIRRIVLAQAVVLSSFGAVLGIGAGAAVAVAGRTRWEQLANTDIAGWAFDPKEIAGAGLAGVLSGLVAAIVPALGAGRMRPVDALAARFRGDNRPKRQRALVGAVALAAGVGFGLVADHELAGGYDGYKRALVGAAITGRDIQPPSAAGPTHLIIIGATLAIIGLAILAPALIGRIAAFGPHLPLSARLAVRDADRHRHRTGPAMGAIVVVVTGSVALALLLASSFHAKQLTDPPSLPAHTLEVQFTGSPATTSTAADEAAAQLSHGRSRTVSIPYIPGKRPIPGRPNADAWTLSVARQDFSCPPHLPAGVCSPIAIPPGGPLAIGGYDATTSLLAYPGLNAAARRALRGGRVLVFDATMLDHSGHVHIATPDGSVELPGTLVPRTRTYRLLPAGLVLAATARRQGWAIASDAALVTYDSHTTRGQIGAAVTAAQRAGAVVLRNTGPNKHVNLILSLIAAVAAFTTFVGVAVSTALSVAESRANLATLAAIGAPPNRRRALTASQALLIGGIGSMLGTALGAFIAFTARTTTGSPRLVVPWPELATTAIGVPLLAALVAAACTPRRAPMLRRAE